MAVSSTRQAAQRSQVPPEIRRFVREACDNPGKIRRFDRRNETMRRGWRFKADRARFSQLPNGYRPGNVWGARGSDRDLYIQIREL